MEGTILLTVEEAAKLAGGDLKPYRIRELTQQKDFYPAIRIKRRVYIHREKFIEWLNQQAS